MPRTLTYFASDVHLGLDVNDPSGRERRFVDFLRSIPAEKTQAVYLLGDIWDFWYEYHDVVPKGSIRVFSAIIDLMEAGVEVFFFKGNHDMWCFHYFESLGMKILPQPSLVEIGGTSFCLGHGDGLGPGHFWYKVMRKVFSCRLAQRLFSMLHPFLAFRFGKGWSKKSRVARKQEYVFKGKSEPLYVFARDFAAVHKVDVFIFGHFHTKVDMRLDTGERLLVLKDWMAPGTMPYICFDGENLTVAE